MPEQDELDRLLDSALATYADPGPDSGLEQHVLSALASERQSGEIRKAAPWLRRWLPWVIAVPLAASLLLWISVARISKEPSSQTQQAHEPNRESTPAASAAVVTARKDFRKMTHPSGAKARGGIAAVAARLKSCPDTEQAIPRQATPCSLKTTVAETFSSLPKLAVFPSPQPLTREEQALVAAAGPGSDAQRQALLAASKPPSDAPLAIADLSIPPLVAPDEGNK